jgi:hypothetical protein
MGTWSYSYDNLNRRRIFDSAQCRKLDAEWLFPQEKVTLHNFHMATSESKNALTGTAANQPGNPNTNYCWGLRQRLSISPASAGLVEAGSSQPFASGSPNCAPAGDGSYSGTWAAQSSDSNNRLAATSQSPGRVSYDAAGDLLNDGLNQYLYDAEGRVCAVASTPVPGMTILTGYIYDADGNRVFPTHRSATPFCQGLR